MMELEKVQNENIDKLSKEFGKGFDKSNLKRMRKLYLTFKNGDSLRHQLSWTHQDIGQMDFYVRYYEKEMKTETDNPTIGIVLCSEKNEAMVKYSVLEESKQIFASKYMLYIPTEEELIREISKERERFELEEAKNFE